MIGANVAGWIVRAVLADDGDLRRYAVTHADGRTGTLEIAAAGSAAAAGFHERARAAEDVVDRGVDPYGNPYLVRGGPLQAPRIVAASSRDPRRRRRIWIGVAIAVGAIVVLFTLRSGGSSSNRPAPRLSLTATGHWGYGCGASFEVELASSAPSTIELLGKRLSTTGRALPARDHVALDRPRGPHATLRLTRGELGGRTSIPVHATSEDGLTADATLTVPANDVPALSRGEILTGRPSVYAATATIDGARLELSSSYRTNPGVAAGHVVFAFETCEVPPGTTNQGFAAVTIDDKHARVDVDIPELLMHTGGVDPPKRLEVAVKIGGAAVTIAFDAPSDVYFEDSFARLADVAKQPVVDAPLPAEVAAPRPIVVMWNGRLDRKLLGDAAPASVPYVAVVTTDEVRIGSCGPYGSYGDLHYAKRFRTTARARLYEARTGKLIAQRSFKGPIESCPYTITTYNGRPSSVGGGFDGEAVRSWLRTQQRR